MAFPKVNPKPNRILWNRGRDTIDEIVIHNPAMVHLEQLDSATHWLAIYLSDDPYKRVSVFFNARSKRVECVMQDEDIRWDEDEEHE